MECFFHIRVTGNQLCVLLNKWIRLLSESFSFLQCGGWWCWLWGRCISGKRILAWASDAQLHHQHWALWGTITLYARGPTAPASLQTPTLAIYSPQTGWGRGHQALTLALRELWALHWPPGQTGFSSSVLFIYAGLRYGMVIKAVTFNIYVLINHMRLLVLNGFSAMIEE